MTFIGNPKGTFFLKKKKPKVNKELEPTRDVLEGSPSLPDVDVSQLGSGTKGIQNKLKAMKLHTNNAKKKYDKFISLNL